MKDSPQGDLFAGQAPQPQLQVSKNLPIQIHPMLVFYIAISLTPFQRNQYRRAYAPVPAAACLNADEVGLHLLSHRSGSTIPRGFPGAFSLHVSRHRQHCHSFNEKRLLLEQHRVRMSICSQQFEVDRWTGKGRNEFRSETGDVAMQGPALVSTGVRTLTFRL